MNRFLAFLIAWAAIGASAAVTPLPGATPQTRAVGEHFQPARVLVTDAAGNPVPGVYIGWSHPMLDFPGGMFTESGDCVIDAGVNCWAPTNEQGIAQVAALVARKAGTYTFPISSHYGSTNLQLTVTEKADRASIVVLGDGSTRVGVIGTFFASSFQARAVNADGAPFASARVVFKVTSPYGNASGTFLTGSTPDPPQCETTTNAGGIAASCAFKAGWGLGLGNVTAELLDASGQVVASDTVDFTNVNVTTNATFYERRTFTSFQDLWWGGIAENGWGLAVVQHSESLFSALFAYDAQGNPTWYVQHEGDWDAGLGSRYVGSVYSPRSSPYFAYDVSRFDLGPANNAYSFSFNGPDVGTLSARAGAGPVVDKRISRLDFSSDTPAPMEGVGGLWWGGVQQDGWGVVVVEKKGVLFSLWFTYDETGKAIWFPMEDGRWTNATTYSGIIYRTSSSPWPYDYSPSQLRAVEAGAFSFRFVDRDHMTFDYRLDGRIASIPLQRL